MKRPNFTINFFSTKSEGIPLRGYVLRPRNVEGKLPTVILSHGIGSDMLISFTYALPFVNHGYNVFCYDFPNSGSGISGGHSVDMSLLSEKQDVINMIDYVKGIDYVDNDHIILSGCSQGGITSALAAAEREDDVERMILYYPAFSIPDLAREGHLMTARYDPNNIPEKQWILFMKINQKYVKDAMSIDPYKEMCTYSKPVLIIHGIEDGMIDINYSRRAAKEYPDCELIEIHGDHGFIKRGAIKSAKVTNEYLDKLAKEAVNS